jgi:uroporphyrinogen-III decarboxylase
MQDDIQNIHPKKEAMLVALENALGIVTTASKVAGIARITHYSWMRDDPEYKKAVEELLEVVLDFTESALHKRIKEGSDTAIIFHLKTKGRGRGYIERRDIAVAVEEIVIKERASQDLELD